MRCQERQHPARNPMTGRALRSMCASADGVEPNIIGGGLPVGLTLTVALRAVPGAAAPLSLGVRELDDDLDVVRLARAHARTTLAARAV